MLHTYSDYIKSARLAGGTKLLPVDKLRIAIHIASSVADLHQVSYFHNDLDCHQYLMQDGIFKLNDFNMAKPIYHNTTQNATTSCTWDHFEGDKWSWKGRSLEEFQDILSYVNYTQATPQNVDLWMMGNLLYLIMTDQYPFENYRFKDAAKRWIANERPPFPKYIESSTDPSFIAIKTALDRCWTYDWRERPSALSIATYLMKKLREITGEVDPVVRVTLPDSKQSGGSGDSDFTKANFDHDSTDGYYRTGIYAHKYGKIEHIS